MGGTDTDVEMKNADSPPGLEAGDSKRDADLQNVLEIREHARQIEKAVSNKETRFIQRVLRCLSNTRRKLNGVVLRSLINQIYPVSEQDQFLSFIEEAAGEHDNTQTRARSATKSPVPEVDAYINLLILVRLIDTNKLQEAERCSQSLMNKLTSQNRRTSDHIAAKCYFYHSRVAELTNKLDSIRVLRYLV